MGQPYQPAIAEPDELDAPPRIHNRPMPGHWDPIVVDRSVPPFEARPVAGDAPPDTVCDGWSTDDFTVRMVSSRGDAHRHQGLRRQDHAEVTAHPSGTLLFAVLDGVSSASHADVGAQSAGFAAVRAMWRILDAGPALDWSAVVGAAAEALLRHPKYGRTAAETAADVERRLATTLVAGVVRAGGPATVVRIGDSGAWLLRDGTYRSAFRLKDTSDTVSSAVEPLPRVPAGLSPVEVPLDPGSVLLVGTDGIGDPLGDGTGLVGDLLAGGLRTPPPLLGFAHLVGFSRETFDDDRTLVAIWPRRRQTVYRSQYTDDRRPA